MLISFFVIFFVFLEYFFLYFCSMNFKNILLFKTYLKIKERLPEYILSETIKLIPLNFISSIFEIIGLFILFPIINIIIDPTLIEKNQLVNIIFIKFNFPNHISFVLFLFGSATFLFLFKNFLIYLISKKQINVAHNLATRLSFDRYVSYIKSTYYFHANNNPAVLLRNFVQLPFELINYIILPFVTIINEFFILFIIIIGITFYDPILFWSLIIFMIPFFFIYNKFFKKKLNDISLRRDKESAALFKLGLQSMESYREIIFFDKIDFFKPKFKRNLDEYSKSMAEVYLINSFSPKFVETIAVIAIFLILLFGYFLEKDLNALAQFLILFAIATFRLIPSMNKIILSFNYIKASSSVFNHFDFKSEKNSFKSIKNNETFSTISFNKTLEIKELSFGFEEKNNILKNINLTIKKGSTIGIVGVSGAGKSTLLNILLRLFEETKGGIYVDDVKVNKSNLSSWYRLVSYVPQNITLLDGSIRENIAFGIPENEINNELLNSVIKQSQLEDFIRLLPKGTYSEIGEKGVKISGGQRQRIGIARALYHGGQVLIFDEATSSLDNETEEMLTESINNISNKNYTIIIVAHRIQTLKYCDVIYKLENGILLNEKI
jgi:ATP-binding cassette, subfamily B, bacterial PglK